MQRISKPFSSATLLIVAALTGGCATLRSQQTEEAFVRKVESIRAIAAARTDVCIERPLHTLPEYEELEYSARYLGMTVARITVAIRGLTEVRGRPAYKFELTARTAGFFARVFEVKDIMVSYMDAEHHRVLRQEVDRREGRYRKKAVVDFDYDRGEAVFTHLLNGTTKTIPIPQQLHDAITANYYFRMMPLQYGDTIDMKVFVSESLYDVFGLIEDTMNMKVPGYGREEVFVFQPYARLDGNLVRKGNATGWFMTRARRIPVRGIFKAPVFGSALIQLREAKYTEDYAASR